MAKKVSEKTSKQEPPVTVQDAPLLEEKKGPTLEERMSLLEKYCVEYNESITDTTESLYKRQVKFEDHTIKRLKAHNQALRFGLYAVIVLTITTLVIFETNRPVKYIIR